jgi:hypothetical protein
MSSECCFVLPDADGRGDPAQRDLTDSTVTRNIGIPFGAFLFPCRGRVLLRCFV